MSEKSRSAGARTSPVRPLGEMRQQDRVHQSAAAISSLQQSLSSEPLVHDQVVAIEEEHNDAAAAQTNRTTQDNNDDDFFRSHHIIQPSDTFSGICLKYGITATQLRRANFGFSGTNLALAPNPLRIPKNHLQHGGFLSSSPNTRSSTTPQLLLSFDNQEQYIRNLRRIYEKSDTPLAETEARCYLELNDWNLAHAMENISQDLQGKKEHALDPNGEEARFDTPLEFVVIDEEL